MRPLGNAVTVAMAAATMVSVAEVVAAVAMGTATGCGPGAPGGNGNRGTNAASAGARGHAVVKSDNNMPTQYRTHYQKHCAVESALPSVGV